MHKLKRFINYSNLTEMSLPWLQSKSSRQSSKSDSRSRSASPELGKPRRNVDQFGRTVPLKQKSRSRSNSSSSRSESESSRQSKGRKGRARKHSRERHRRRRQDDSSSNSEVDSTSSSGHTRVVASNKPKYLNARVFVANIISKEITKDVLIKQFEKYGKIVDVLVHSKNYAFIQFAKETEASLAVEGENGSTLQGWRIDVKLAAQNRKGIGNNGGKIQKNEYAGIRQSKERKGGRFGSPEKQDRRSPLRDRSPLHDSQRSNPYLMRPPLPYPAPGNYGLRDPYYMYPYRRGFPDPWYDEGLYRPGSYLDPYRDPFRPLPPPPAVECEIFVMNAQLRTYGETVERRINEQNILAAVSVMPEGRTTMQLLEEMTANKVLFAIFIQPQNETHRSLTLNILHGSPQEHRNMPLEDAVVLVRRSFLNHMESLREKSRTSAPTSPASSAFPGSTHAFLPPSSDVVYFLNLLADHRTVTVTELDTVISYLQEYRTKLVGPESRPKLTEENFPKTVPPVQATIVAQPPAKDKGPVSIHQELKDKIFSLFGGAANNIQGVLPAVGAQQQSSFLTTSLPAVAPAPPPQTQLPIPSSASLINFDNPNVQKALDRLIQSGPNLLKRTCTKPAPAVGASIFSSTPRALADSSFHQLEDMIPSQAQAQMLNVDNQMPLSNSYETVQGPAAMTFQTGYSLQGGQEHAAQRY